MLQGNRHKGGEKPCVKGVPHPSSHLGDTAYLHPLQHYPHPVQFSVILLPASLLA